MKAIRIYENGNLEKLIYDDIDEPDCIDGYVKIQIEATSINHLDIWVRQGVAGNKYNLPIILGSDGSGTIVDINVEKSNLKIGDEVILQPGIFCSKCKFCKDGKENYCIKYGILGETENGTQSEYILAKPQNIFLKPKCLSFQEAASMPLVFMTAYQMIHKRAQLKKNETILIYGGASGIGMAAIQICKDLGASIIATAGSKRKCEFILNLGVENVINHNDSEWSLQVKDITNNLGVDVVFEHIGYKTWYNSLKFLNIGGRIVTCGATTGPNVKLHLSHLFMKQQSILGSTMSDIDTFKKVIKKIEKKVYKPIVDKVFSISDIKNAHKYIEERKNIGKIVVCN